MECKYAGWVFVLLMMTACGGPRYTNAQQFIGRSVIFPESLFGRLMGKDTLLEYLDTVRSPKLVIYYDSRNCNPCRMNELPDWQKYLAELDTVAPDLKCRMILAVNENARRLDFEFRQHRFPYPVYYDEQKAFETVNILPWEQEFHTFLLDRDNRVVLVGSPVGNPKMWELYKRTIGQLVRNGGKMPSALVE